MATFYGYLHSWTHTPDRHEKNNHEETNELSTILQSKNEFEKYTGKSLNKFRNWETYRVISQRPLMGEEPDLFPGPYPYPFYLYKNPLTGNVLIGSLRYNITNHIVETLNFFLTRNLIRNSINVQKVTNSIIEKREKREKKDFFTTNLQLDINSFGSKLETLTLYGSDVIDAGFLDIFSSGDYTARQIGLTTPESSAESARLLGHGGIQFYADRLRELEKCLSFVHSIGGFIRNI